MSDLFASAQENRRREWLTVAEFARELGASPASVYRAIAADQLPAVRFGGRKFIPAKVRDELSYAALAAGRQVTLAEVFGGPS